MTLLTRRVACQCPAISLRARPEQSLVALTQTRTELRVSASDKYTIDGNKMLPTGVYSVRCTFISFRSTGLSSQSLLDVELF